VRRDAVMEGEALSGYDAMLLPVTKPASLLPARANARGDKQARFTTIESTLSIW